MPIRGGRGLHGHSPAIPAQLENFFNNRRKIGQKEIAMDISNPGRLKEQGRAAGNSSSFGVLPFVADDERVVEIEMPFETRFRQQTGFRFSAGAAIGLVVRAEKQVVERQQ